MFNHEKNNLKGKYCIWNLSTRLTKKQVGKQFSLFNIQQQ